MSIIPKSIPKGSGTGETSVFLYELWSGYKEDKLLAKKSDWSMQLLKLEG